MFRPILSSILLSLYLFSAIGISGAVHYCGGEMASIEFFQTDEHSCPCGMEVMDPDCCKNKHFEVKIKDDHQSYSKVKVASLSPVILHSSPAIISSLDIQVKPSTIKYVDVEREPPDIRLYQLYESYLI